MRSRTKGPSRSGVVRLAAVLMLGEAAALTGQTQDRALLDVLAHDSGGLPVAAARIDIRAGSRIVASASTDSAGRAEVRGIDPGRYDLAITKDGFEPSGKKGLELTDASPLAIDLTLI